MGRPEALLQVTGSNVHGKSGNILETAQDRDAIFTADQ